MKKTIRLTESELKGLIRESVKTVLNEDYDLTTDFEDGGNQIDRDTLHMSPNEKDDYIKDLVLGDKRQRNDNYEAYRGDSRYFWYNMLCKKVGDKTAQGLTHVLKGCEGEFKKYMKMLNGIVEDLYSGYEESGDERYILAAKQFVEEAEGETKDLRYGGKREYVTADFRILSDEIADYSQLSMDKVYSRDPETDRRYSRNATTQDRKYGLNGTMD